MNRSSAFSHELFVWYLPSYLSWRDAQWTALLLSLLDVLHFIPTEIGVTNPNNGESFNIDRCRAWSIAELSGLGPISIQPTLASSEKACVRIHSD